MQVILKNMQRAAKKETGLMELLKNNYLLIFNIFDFVFGNF